MERLITQKVTGQRTQDGAGVSLVRVLGYNTAEAFDPVLMLDSFDSSNPDDYTAGFPMHPHRGIETISYVYQGGMTHRDSLGNADTIADGEVQWMTAGSGILHEEMLPAAIRMLGVQLWLNLASKDKMTAPAYHSVKKEEIKEIPLEKGFLRLLAGRYKEYSGFLSSYLPFDYYDIHLPLGAETTIPSDIDDSVMLFTLLGDCKIAGQFVKEKTAVKLSEGTFTTIQAESDEVQVLYVSSKKLGESIAWGGPIVMNTLEELNKAFEELDEGTFLKKKIVYEK